MLNKLFLQKVSKFISLHKLMQRDKKYLVALSGGADSITLALALKELGYTIEAAHCNFHLRGDESNRDEKFCKKFCNDNGIALHITHFDTKGFALLRKISIEMAARHLRYAYFNQLANDINASAICVAHHQDDSVETVLLNLIRGTGLHGLTGIKPKNGNIVRPLLCVTRHEIETALTEAGQEYVTDSTNLIDDVVRNKIRLDILPLMKEINPSVSHSIAGTAERVAEAATALDTIAENTVHTALTRNGGSTRISIQAIVQEPASGYILFRLLKDYDFTPAQIEQIRSSMTSEPGRIYFSQTHKLLIDRSCLIIEPKEDIGQRPVIIPECGLYVINNKMKIRVEKVSRDNGFAIPTADKCCCMADAANVVFPLTIRLVAPGDRFKPFGMNGSKLVSDYLTDIKLNLFDKQRQLIMTDAEGHTVWLVGLRPDDRIRITGHTAEAIKITYMTNGSEHNKTDNKQGG